jgi:hypothetical protein
MSILERKFGATGRKGDSGEVLLYNHLQRLYTVTDYRKDLRVQSKGVDFGITKSGWNREFTLDSKCNLYIEPNFFSFKIELESNGKPGWFFTSTADRIYHVSAYCKKYLYYDLSEFRHFVVMHLLKNKVNPVTFNSDVLLTFTNKDALPNYIKLYNL